MTEHRSLSWAQKEAQRDHMKGSERGGEIVGVAAIVLVALFFYAHQAWSTGFSVLLLALLKHFSYMAQFSLVL